MSSIHDKAVDVERLAAIDLNLVVAFDAMARERSVTAAAERTGVTQSAMSHTLRRLRDLLGDPLLVRGGGGMLLTPRAEALVVPVRSALVTLARALSEAHRFEPQTSRRSFRIASPDLFDVLVAPSLLEHVRAVAPGVSLSMVPVLERPLLDELETGDVDVAVAPRAADMPSSYASAPGLARRTLFRDGWLCLIRADHPALERGGDGAPRLSLERYASLAHVLVAPTGAGDGPVDVELARRGVKRRIVMRVPHFHSAPAIVARGDVVLTAPSSLAALFREAAELTVVPVPLDMGEHDLDLVWHERYSADSGHSWLRELAARVAQSAHGDAMRAVARRFPSCVG